MNRLDPETTTLRELVETELRPEVYGPEKCRDRAAPCQGGFRAVTRCHRARSRGWGLGLGARAARWTVQDLVPEREASVHGSAG